MLPNVKHGKLNTHIFFTKVAPSCCSETGCRRPQRAGALSEKERLLDNTTNDFIFFFPSVPPPWWFFILPENFFPLRHL